MATDIPTISLNNGVLMPVLGLGTWRAKPGEVSQAVKHAIECGVRHFDCAMLYGNEAEVGTAIAETIQEGLIKREDIFVTSKLWCNRMRPDLVEVTLEKSLENFGLDYLDLYLIHWPMAFQEADDYWPLDADGNLICSDVDYSDTWTAMEAVYKKGLTRAIGVSNFNIKQLKRLLHTAHIIPAVNQIEFHPYLNQKDLLSFCTAHGIVVVGYAPLGSNDRPWAKASDPLLLDDPIIKSLAKSYKKTPAQIILRYLVQLGVVPIPKSSNKKRIAENTNIFDFSLKHQDMEKMDRLNSDTRYHPHNEARDHTDYPFGDVCHSTMLY